MRLYIKKLDNFNCKPIDFSYFNNRIKFCYIDKDFTNNLFSPFEDKINICEDDQSYKKFFGIINFSNFEENKLKFMLFKINNNEPGYFLKANNIEIQELKGCIKSICFLEIIEKCVVYGSLTGDDSASKNIDIFISKIFNREIISDHIPNFNILKEIQNIGVSKIDFDIIANKNYNNMKKDSCITNCIKAISNVLWNNGKNHSDKKNDLRLKISISSENNKKKDGYNNLEKLKSEALKLIDEDDFEDKYTIYLKNDNKIKSSQLILSKLINICKKDDVENIAKNVFLEMDNFFNEKLKDINEVLHDD